MLHIVLVEPEIPQNCGNMARTWGMVMWDSSTIMRKSSGK